MNIKIFLFAFLLLFFWIQYKFLSKDTQLKIKYEINLISHRERKKKKTSKREVGNSHAREQRLIYWNKYCECITQAKLKINKNVKQYTTFRKLNCMEEKTILWFQSKSLTWMLLNRATESHSVSLTFDFLFCKMGLVEG